MPYLRGHQLLSFVDGTNVAPPMMITKTTTEGATQELNPAYQSWLQHDQMVLSTLLSSFSISTGAGLVHDLRCRSLESTRRHVRVTIASKDHANSDADGGSQEERHDCYRLLQQDEVLCGQLGICRTTSMIGRSHLLCASRLECGI